MGGGTILILLLSGFIGTEQHVAQATNIIFFIPSAIAAVVIGIKNKNINLKIAIPICIGGMIGATIGASISTKMNVQVLKKCFGFFLVLIALYQTYEYIKERKGNNTVK